jgi:putative colanic acid biosynthesis UDP-glucose lipid carrier transferase
MLIKKGFLRAHADTLEFILRLTDVFLVALAGTLALGIINPDLQNTKFTHGAAIIVGALLTALILPAFSVYQSWRGKWLFELFFRLTAAWLTVIIILISISFLTGTSTYFSRTWFALWGTLGIILLLLARAITFKTLKILRRHGLNIRRVLIVGAGVVGNDLARRVQSSEWTGYQVVGFLDDDPEKQNKKYSTHTVIGPIDSIAQISTSHSIDEVWITLPLRAEERIHDIIHMLRHQTVNIRFVPDIYSFRLLNHALSEVVGLPMMDLSASPMTGLNRIIKAAEDYSLSIILIIILSPLMACIAILIKIFSPGPIIYRQERIGWNGKPFMMLKFRTMETDAEADGICWGGAQHKPTTRIGEFLRRTSLDELPQLFNVLKGEMSIVGPRPERPMFVEQFKDEIQDYMKKHLVKAGITGWAQVNGFRGDTDLRKRIQYDLYYIEHWSLAFDLKIIAMTLIKGLIHKNAY